MNIRKREGIRRLSLLGGGRGWGKEEKDEEKRWRRRRERKMIVMCCLQGYRGTFVCGKRLNCDKNFTFEPWILKICKVLADSEAVTRAVNIEMMITPVIIHRMQNTRPRADLGERSPYL